MLSIMGRGTNEDSSLKQQVPPQPRLGTEQRMDVCCCSANVPVLRAQTQPGVSPSHVTQSDNNNPLQI